MKKYIILLSVLFCSIQAFSQYGYFKPDYIGWPPGMDSTVQWVMVFDTTEGHGAWLHPDSLQAMGSDSVSFEGDSVCIFDMGVEYCVSLDSIYFTDSTLCYIILPDTSCVTWNGTGLTLYTGNGVINEHRIIEAGSNSISFQRSGSSVFRLHMHPGTPGDVLTISKPLANASQTHLALTSSLSQTNADVKMRFQATGGTGVHYSLGVDRSETAFTLSENNDLGADPVFHYYGGGDSLVIEKDFQLDSFLLDSDGDYPAVGEVLTGTATGVNWGAAGGGTTYTGSNGITLNVTDFNLGGSLTGNTTIATGSSTLTLSTATASETPLDIQATTGTALNIDATSGHAIWAQNTGSSPVQRLEKTTTATNTIQAMLYVKSTSTGSTANGFGVGVQHVLESAGGSDEVAYKTESLWKNATTRNTQFDSYLMNSSGVSTRRLSIEGDGGARLYGRIQNAKGANVASANDLTLGLDGNLFHITGSTQINALITADWQAGSEITLIFDSNPTVKNNTSGGAGTAVLLLQGGVDFVASANDVLKLVYDGTSWFEVSRSIN